MFFPMFTRNSYKFIANPAFATYLNYTLQLCTFTAAEDPNTDYNTPNQYADATNHDDI